MAHITSCMLGSGTEDVSLSPNNYIAPGVSPQTSNESLGRASPSGDKPFVWRMHQTERKYQLFPKDKQAAAAAGKSLDPEQAFALAMGQNGEKSDKPAAGTGLRIRIKEHNLIRRRKVSVPDLGPMTTVQEVAMDSPTIPGRPPLHERSISAPGTSWKQHHLFEHSALSKSQILDERLELGSASSCPAKDEARRSPPGARQPLSPKTLAPLVIPALNSAVPRLTHQMSLSRLRSGSTPIEAPIRSARTDDSPRVRTPYTPLSAALTTPKSAATSVMTASTLPTPLSAPIESRSSPKPWEKAANYAAVSTPKEGTPEAACTPKADPLDTPLTASATGHRRNQSESGSIMERGRPRKRSESGGVNGRAESKRSKSAERRAFELLPKGWKATDAMNMMRQEEIAAIQKQALQQAARFEVLRKEDVDNLSRELRQLDERTEYLRRTYTSLRAGRRNLHTRICQYLRSPRTAKFSHDSMLKQEEALAELDASIDDWVNKLEQAENRRTRVRQKLLEHVAAAATLSVSAGGIVGVSESLQHAMGVRPLNPATAPSNISTPPRSPTKLSFTSHAQSSSPSPQRVVAQVPSTILEQPLFEEAASMRPNVESKAEVPAPLRRAETIRIYADNDVYALLADVEHAITKMSGRDFSPIKDESMPEAGRRKINRSRSHELLKASTNKPLPSLIDAEKACSSSTPSLPIAVPSPSIDVPMEEIFLTSAVFKPERSFTVC